MIIHRSIHSSTNWKVALPDPAKNSSPCQVGDSCNQKAVDCEAATEVIQLVKQLVKGV